VKLSLDIAQGDLMAFNRYYYDTDRDVRRRVRVRQYIWPVLFFLIGWMLREDSDIVFAYFFGVGLLWLLFYSRYAAIRWDKKVKKEIGKPENEIWLGKQEMELDDEKIKTVFDKGEQTVLWSVFIKSAETQSHFFLFQTPRQAFIVPKQAMTAAQVDEFRQLLNNKIKQ
jgi:hypothetical protein